MRGSREVTDGRNLAAGIAGERNCPVGSGATKSSPPTVTASIQAMEAVVGHRGRRRERPNRRGRRSAAASRGGGQEPEQAGVEACSGVVRRWG
ncbi:hypothetical protein PR202_gb11724 [Eleusine coracana subsp. coracana]|uniref:Uncharacterized protein n=1 Tax=Eleusine coracana subsp. coracana TaxID=191504 RepID=A0AAV5EMY4_ELECO|nr:hypothetical protein PR202_gb11724 [Eleusine coracana subsp. coracana]